MHNRSCFAQVILRYMLAEQHIASRKILVSVEAGAVWCRRISLRKNRANTFMKLFRLLTNDDNNVISFLLREWTSKCGYGTGQIDGSALICYKRFVLIECVFKPLNERTGLPGQVPHVSSIGPLLRNPARHSCVAKRNHDVVFSIETTPVIAAKEPEKLKALSACGYKRMSMGIQTVSEKLLNELGREGATLIYDQAVKHVREAGCTRLNLDLMYGFLHQSNDEFESTLRYTISLQPEYITL